MPPPLSANDPARAALDQRDDILARLNAAVAGAGADAPVDTTEPEKPSSEEPTTRELTDEALAAYQTSFNAATQRKDEPEILRIAADAKAALAGELARREQELQRARDYFDGALRERGEAASETREASDLVRRWEESVAATRVLVEDPELFDAEAVIQFLHTPEQPRSLEEHLRLLERAEAAYRQRLEELKTEKKDVASRLAEERIAKLKASIGAAS